MNTKPVMLAAFLGISQAVAAAGSDPAAEQIECLSRINNAIARFVTEYVPDFEIALDSVRKSPSRDGYRRLVEAFKRTMSPPLGELLDHSSSCGVPEGHSEYVRSTRLLYAAYLPQRRVQQTAACLKLPYAGFGEIETPLVFDEAVIQRLKTCPRL